MSQPWTFRQLYQLLARTIEPGIWWPAESEFEVGVGAILTQNTAWVNVEMALEALRTADLLHPSGIATLPLDELKTLIRPAGFMNAKAQYLKNYTTWFLTNQDLAPTLATPELRSSLLAVRGVGPETADDLLLYVYDRAVFIWDTYARRFLAAAGYPVAQGYEPTRRRLSHVMAEAEFTVAEQQRFHGLIVEAGKQATAAGGWETYWAQLNGGTSGSA